MGTLDSQDFDDRLQKDADNTDVSKNQLHSSGQWQSHLYHWLTRTLEYNQDYHCHRIQGFYLFFNHETEKYFCQEYNQDYQCNSIVCGLFGEINIKILRVLNFTVTGSHIMKMNIAISANCRNTIKSRSYFNFLMITTRALQPHYSCPCHYIDTYKLRLRNGTVILLLISGGNSRLPLSAFITC